MNEIYCCNLPVTPCVEHTTHLQIFTHFRSSTLRASPCPLSFPHVSFVLMHTSVCMMCWSLLFESILGIRRYCSHRLMSFENKSIVIGVTHVIALNFATHAESVRVSETEHEKTPLYCRKLFANNIVKRWSHTSSTSSHRITSHHITPFIR